LARSTATELAWVFARQNQHEMPGSRPKPYGDLHDEDEDIEIDLHDEPAHRDHRQQAGRINPVVLTTYQASRPSGLAAFNNKGDISNICTFCLFLFALLLRTGGVNTFNEYLLAMGLFGFAGGITNWLAIKMLFDIVKIGPYMLAGSGVIPRQFKQIRLVVKNTIMKTFFDEEYLGRYLRERSKSLLDSVDLPAKIEAMLSKPGMDATLTTKLTEMAARPEGMMLNTMAGMFGGVPGMVPVIKPMLLSFGKEMSIIMTENFDPLEYVSVGRVRDEINSLMEEKLQVLTPSMVKALMEEVIRSHLGWLIVWGNVFGAFIGVTCKIFGY
jgi:hypothetical protein